MNTALYTLVIHLCEPTLLLHLISGFLPANWNVEMKPKVVEQDIMNVSWNQFSLMQGTL